MRKSKGLRDVSASTNFLKTLARNGRVSVSFIQDLKVPYASPDGSIHLPVPTIDTLDEWNYLCHHEVSHCFPANRYHFPAVPIAHGLKAGMIMNIILDNLAERHEFNRYEGRREILSRGILDMVKKLETRMMFKKPENVHEELTLGLIAWDCEQRTSWMGYPFNTYQSPVGQYKGVCEYLDKIELERLLAEQKTTDDLIAILHKVLAYTEQEREEEDEKEDEKEDTEPGEEDTEPGEDSSESGDDSSKPTGGGESEQGGDQETPEDSEGSEGSGSKRDDDSETEGSRGSDDPEGRSGESENGDRQSDSDDPENGGETERPGGNDPEAEDEPQAPTEQDDEGKKRFVLSPTEPYNGDNVAPETKKLVEELLMIVENNKVPTEEGPYQPTPRIDWIPLRERPSPHDINTINKLIGTSKVSKSIQKYLHAVSQTSYQYGTKTGRLSSRSIYKTGGGCANIFKKRVSSRIERNTAVTLLTDCSGSMENGYGCAKYKTAFSCIAIMAQTLTDLRIPHEILGFTEQEILGEARVEMFEFKSFNEMLKQPAMISRLASCPEMWNNHDAESILEAASRLSTRKEKNKLLIVLSDGNPVGHFYPGAWEAREYLKEVCSHIEEDTDIDLFGIGIESPSVKHYYRDYEIVHRASDMDQALMMLLKKKVLK